MPKRVGRLGLVVAAAALAVGCGTSPESNSDPKEVRIVTLSGDLTELVYALGSGESVVGVDVTTVAPEPALDLPVVGLGRFITVEGVLDVEPTLVLADSQSGPPDALEQIEATGVVVETLEVPASFDALYERIGRLGEILGQTDTAAELSDTLRSEVSELTRSTSSSPLRVAYVYTRGPDVVLLFGEGMTSQPLIEAAGAVDAGAQSGVVGSASVSAEGLIAAEPDVIVVPEEGLSILGGVDELLKVPGVAETPAGQNRAILVYPEGDFLTFGPRIGDSLRLLVEDLEQFTP